MQQVTLNKKSWHYKYYSSVVGDYAPRSLCPYFWTMVLIILMSPLFGLAWFAIQTITFTSNFFDKIVQKKSDNVVVNQKRYTDEEWDKYFEEQEQKAIAKKERWDKITNKFQIFFKWVLLPLIVSFILYLVFGFVKKNGVLLTLAIIATLIVFICVVWLFIWLVEKYAQKVGNGLFGALKYVNPLRWKALQIIGEMIKAWYTKACPLITWQGDTENDLEISKNFSND